MSRQFIEEFTQIINQSADLLKIKIHLNQLENKEHTLDCLIRRYFLEMNTGELRRRYDVYDPLSVNEVTLGKFGCDFLDHEFPNMIDLNEYNQLIVEPCSYSNNAYAQYFSIDRFYAHTGFIVLCPLLDEVFENEYCTRIGNNSAIINQQFRTN